MTDERTPPCEEQDREPTWLDERRNRQGLIVFPIPSREPDEVDDRLLLADIAFNKHSVNDGHHVSPSDNAMVQVGTDGIEVQLVQGIQEEMFKKTLTAATRATIGLDLKQALPGQWEDCADYAAYLTEFGAAFAKDKNASFGSKPKCGHDDHRSVGDWDDYEGHVPIPDWEEMMKGGLQTALETQTIVFAVSGVSRTCTHQLVRSRKAAFHQQSQRASYMGDHPECRMPESVWRNRRARAEYLKLVTQSWRTYRICCDEDISYQDSRFALLEGTTNFIMLEYPIREFINVFAYRGCSMFQWEIVDVMRKCRDALIEAHPFMEPYVKISCEKTGPAVVPLQIEGYPTGGTYPERTTTVEHHCTFQGWESPEGQCDFPWAKDEARTFKPEFHQIGRRTGKEGGA